MLLKPLTNVFVARGAPFELKCLVESGRQPHVVWTKDGRPVGPGPGSPYHTELANGICRLAVNEAFAGGYRGWRRRRVGWGGLEELRCRLGGENTPGWVSFCCCCSQKGKVLHDI